MTTVLGRPFLRGLTDEHEGGTYGDEPTAPIALCCISKPRILIAMASAAEVNVMLMKRNILEKKLE